MPIYEYQALKKKESCPECRVVFEVIQDINEDPLSSCIYCGNKVKKLISYSHSTVIEQSEEHKNTINRIKEYENSGMWSHAAELADTHSENINDKNLKNRALDNYKKAGYNPDSLAKHVKGKI